MAGDNQQPQHGVRSPCVSLCRIDGETQQCRGCRRTLAEIAAWSGASDEEKRAIWRRIRQRAEQGDKRIL
ncbi:DUF1289 domain-containing protein [Serratia ficaria]|uniref:DUF1289 domain-containing protein n=1 Tax=Serratia ficaria TaxID=61651 RepID=UPI0021781025|nr:DUF1289 domain-containing protein [Serratia ficaria]MEE4484762.1 DUF1289 domain-containing protein [Serratia ficaria]CAI1158868.1 Predicted Fe-S protein [Serratia ficaria]CAI1173180.1 Predicted Fe-S protein [Serratia ficaria]CAI1977470.1 Predicted Fe-S protein [Serratia ficaria]CAI2522880.1 Predicted Fe-S protein [Serratia ficaria]